MESRLLLHMLHLKQALWYTCKHNINVFVLHPFPPQGVKQFIHRSEGSDGEDYIGLKQIGLRDLMERITLDLNR